MKTLIIGKQYTINYTTENIPYDLIESDFLRVNLSINGGIDFNPIIGLESIVNTGNFTFIVPDSETEDGILQIIALDNETGNEIPEIFKNINVRITYEGAVSMNNQSPDVSNYQVGKGVVYFDKFDEDGVKTGELDLGNDPTFSLNLNVEELEHFSSRKGLKEKDKIAVISASIEGKFTLDEINKENLQLAFMGNDITHLTQVGASVTNESVTAHVGKYSSFTYRKITDGSVTVTDSTGATTYNEDTDYEIDYDSGRIKILSDAAISDEESLLVDYTYGTISIPQINIAENTEIQGQLRFKGDCTLGYNYEIILWKVKLSPSGDINFISEDWNKLEFNFKGMVDDVNHPDQPWGVILDLEHDTVTES